MNIPVSLQEYAQLVRRINVELTNSLWVAFYGAANVELVGSQELGSGVVFAVRNCTRQLNIKSVVIPFGFDPSMDLLADVNRVVVVASGSARMDPDAHWAEDVNFAENGIMTMSLPSLDEDAIAAAAAVIVEEIRMHLSFERELAY